MTSTQQGVHSRLPVLVQKHLNHRYQTPVAPHSALAYQTLREQLTLQPRPLVLDSFCGTGHSTRELARKHPDHLVVGVDKSAHRLEKHPEAPGGNYMLLQANCEDIWQLLLQDGLTLDYHYLLYPNPWPKPGHLQRRVHAHPAFRILLALSGRLELRSNWQLYVEEFGVALHLAGHQASVTCIEPRQPLTLFERKYQASGHPLWACYCQVNPGTP